MAGFSAPSYRKLALETDVVAADPHRLILILFDGALESIQRAKGLIAERRVAEKGEAIGRALRIIDCGLCASVDPRHAPAFAGRLIALYRYILRLLLQANARDDAAQLDEAASLLGQLRTAWASIAPEPAAAQGSPAEAPASGAASGRAGRLAQAYGA